MRTRENLQDEIDRIQARLARPAETTLERRLAEVEVRVRLLMEHRIADLEERIEDSELADLERAARLGVLNPSAFIQPGAPPGERAPMTLAEAMQLSANKAED